MVNTSKLSILSRYPDGAGFYYGYTKGDSRQVNVAPKHPGHPASMWDGYVDGEHVVTALSMANAEVLCLQWMQKHPEPEGTW